MAYCTLDNLNDRFGERYIIDLTDRGETATGTVDLPTVDRAIADADGVIDGYLARRYKLPLTVVQPLIRDIALKITYWNLHISMPDPKTEVDYKEAIRQLTQIANGAITLVADGVTAEGTGNSGARITDRERPFTEENMKGFIG